MIPAPSQGGTFLLLKALTNMKSELTSVTYAALPQTTKQIHSYWVGPVAQPVRWV